MESSPMTGRDHFESVGRLNARDDYFQFFNLTDVGSSPVGVNLSLYNVSYQLTFKFEEIFEPRDAIVSVRNHRWVLNYLIAVYIITVFGIQYYMKKRPRFELKYPLILWNILLASFSTFGAIRVLQEMASVYEVFGGTATYCLSGDPFLDNRVGGFWNWMFTLSKVPELGDTIFIVLRKQPLIFLHWYHHVTVLLYAWYSYSDYISTARWFICMNYLVHSFMYTYYALKAMKFRVPRLIAMSITTAQLAQMVMGTLVNVWAYQVKQAGSECHVSYGNIRLSLLMYTSYFVLFAQFFRKVYLASDKQAMAKLEAKKGAHVESFECEKSKRNKID